MRVLARTYGEVVRCGKNVSHQGCDSYDYTADRGYARMSPYILRTKSVNERFSTNDAVGNVDRLAQQALYS